MPGPDLADLITYAWARRAKLILAGDTSQLQAVENGGGMSLLAGALGYARLAEPTRFRAAWEQDASLRLRDGDTTLLTDYDQHGRIHGGNPEQMIDAAAGAYVAHTCDGTDTLLMAAEHTRPHGPSSCSTTPASARSSPSIAAPGRRLSCPSAGRTYGQPIASTSRVIPGTPPAQRPTLSWLSS